MEIADGFIHCHGTVCNPGVRQLQPTCRQDHSRFPVLCVWWAVSRHRFRACRTLLDQSCIHGIDGRVDATGRRYRSDHRADDGEFSRRIFGQLEFSQPGRSRDGSYRAGERDVTAQPDLKASKVPRKVGGSPPRLKTSLRDHAARRL